MKVRFSKASLVNKPLCLWKNTIGFIPLLKQSFLISISYQLYVFFCSHEEAPVKPIRGVTDFVFVFST